MIGESARLKCFIIVMLIVAISWCGIAAAQTPSPTSQVSPTSSAVNLEARIKAAIDGLPSMRLAEALRIMQNLLKEDVSKASVSVQMEAYNALAAVNKQLAEDARLDKTNPAAERNAEKYVDDEVGAYVKAGKVALAAGDLNGATTVFTKTLNLRPGSEDALLGMARVYAAGGRYLQAIERFQDYFRATKRGPMGTYEPALYVEMGRVYLAAKLWNQAVKSLKSAVDNGGDTDEVASLLSEAYLGLNKPDTALVQVQKAISKSPTQPLYYSRYALILLMQKTLPKAEEKAAEGLNIARTRFRASPDDLKLMEVMGECYGTYSRILSAILANDPSQTKARLALVACTQEQSDLAQLQSLHKALSIIKMAPGSERNNVELLEKQVLLEKAVRHRDLRKSCERLLGVDPKNKVAKDILAKLGSESANPATLPASK